jgi:MFS family permease
MKTARNKLILILQLISTISGIIAMNWFRQQFSTGDYINPTDHEADISPAQSALIVSILSAGTFCGALSAAPFADRLGQRMSLILAVCVFTVGVILQILSLAIPLFVCGRYVVPSEA